MCFLCGYTLGKTRQVFLPTTANIDSEILSYLVEVYWFHLSFLTLLIVRAGREENFFYLKVLRLVILTNRRLENFKVITSSIFKRKRLQNQEKITKTNKSLIKPEQSKPRLKVKQPVKTMKQKKYLFEKKEILANKKGLAQSVKGLGKRVK